MTIIFGQDVSASFSALCGNVLESKEQTKRRAETFDVSDTCQILTRDH